MAEKFVGCTVSIEAVGGLGFYQGLITNVNPETQLITLTKVIHNGKPSKKPEVSLNADIILDLKLLKTKESLNENSSTKSSTRTKRESQSEGKSVQNETTPQKNSHTKVKDFNNVQVKILQRSVDKKSKMPIAPQQNSHTNELCSSPVSNNRTKSSSGSKRRSVGEILADESKPKNEIRPLNNSRSTSSMNSDHRGMMQPFPGTFCSPLPPLMSRNRPLQSPQRSSNKFALAAARRHARDETTFGSPIDDYTMNTEFDFEKNLALFDKQALMDEWQSRKPDVVRQADKRNFRHDENIIPGASSKPPRRILVPAEHAADCQYVTDDGLLVPSVLPTLRRNLFSAATQNGLTKSRMLEMAGRAATETILGLIGASHRLDAGNQHQAPVVVLLCGGHLAGAAGVNCGRQLSGHGVRTVVAPAPSAQSALLDHEMRLYELTKGTVAISTTELPQTLDLIVDARFDAISGGDSESPSPKWINTTTSWASAVRAPLLALDPPSGEPAVPARASLAFALPPDLGAAHGKVLLVNLNIPHGIFESQGIEYMPPFGAKMVIALNPLE